MYKLVLLEWWRFFDDCIRIQQEMFLSSSGFIATGSFNCHHRKSHLQCPSVHDCFDVHFSFLMNKENQEFWNSFYLNWEKIHYRQSSTILATSVVGNIPTLIHEVNLWHLLIHRQLSISFILELTPEPRDALGLWKKNNKIAYKKCHKVCIAWLKSGQYATGFDFNISKSTFSHF